MAFFSSRSDAMPPFDAVLEEVAREAPEAIRPYRPKAAFVTLDRVVVGLMCCASVAFFVGAYSISVQDPDYFSRRLISSLERNSLDPITTGTTAPADAMPAQRVVRGREPVPADYQIVMVYQNEAILSTEDELWRVKVGSRVPGLGEITAIQPTPDGGVVKARLATLRSVKK